MGALSASVARNYKDRMGLGANRELVAKQSQIWASWHPSS